MRYLLSLIFLGLSFIVKSQDPTDFRFESISIAKGLSQSSAYCNFQDHLGYIWIGTQGGMNRFDGYGVKKYEPDANDSTAIGMGWRTAVTEDRSGVIWTGTCFGHFSRYDRKQDRWFNYWPTFGDVFRKKFPMISSSLCGYVTDILVDETSQTLYATTLYTGLYVMDIKKGTFEQYWFPEINPIVTKRYDNNMFRMAKTENGILLVASANGLLQFDTKNKRFIKKEWHSEVSDSTMAFSDILQTEKDEYFLATNKGLLRYHPKSGKTKWYQHQTDNPFSLENNLTRTLSFGNGRKEIWVSMNGVGIDIFDFATENFKHINSQTAPNSGLTNDTYFRMFQDKESNIWIGTSSQGILKYDPTMRKMSVLTKDVPADMPLGFGQVWGVFFDSRENIWVGSLDAGAGVTKIDRKQRKSTRYLNDPKSLEFRRWVFGEDVKGSIYAMGTSKEGRILYQLKENASKFNVITNLTKDVESHKIPIRVNQSFMYLTKKGELITGGDSAMMIADQNGEINISLYNPLLSIPYIKYIYRNDKGNTYILTRTGVWNWDEETGRLKNLTERITLDQSKHLIMPYMEVADNKYIYLPSFGLGLIIIDIAKQEMKILSKIEGIPNQYLYDIAIDKNGFVWSSSNYGIIRYDPKTRKFKGFYKNDGAQDFEFNANCFSKSITGELVYGGLFGANYFRPENIRDNSKAPDVIIQSVNRMGTLMNVESSHSEDLLEVKYNENQLSFEFIAFNFKNPEFNQYAYKMEGFDKDWTYSGSRHFATYTNLPSGKYVFKVKASNNDGVWNEQGARLEIRVYPAPWFSWWAYGIYLLTLLGLIRVFVKYRESIQRRKMEDDRKNSELQAARDFQQSMLPKILPSRNDLDVSTFLRSSTEIGGDYYDFFEQENGDVYIVCGDATGHGIISGMMVSIAKAGLNGISAAAPNEILKQLNNVIKRVDLGTMRMSLNIIQLEKDQFIVSSAAMPPIYHYSKTKNATEEIMLIGLPLGGLRKESFESSMRSFETGDVIVMISDGLPEAPNTNGELFDYHKVKALVDQYGAENAETIKDKIVESVDIWLDGKNNPDDITIIVIKKK